MDTQPRGSGLVLVVDDEPSVLEYIKTLLELENYVVHTADSAEAALQLHDRLGGDLSLVITDVEMPGMSGVVLAQKLSELRDDLPILFISGYTASTIRRQENPSREFLRKPFRQESFISLVRALALQSKRG